MDYHKRRRQGYFSNKPKKPRNFALEPGLKGFLCTCNIREKDCIREAYNILNEYADQLHGNEKEVQKKLAETENVEKESDGEIESALSNEIESIKAESNRTPSERRFQVVESGANNCIFIRTSLDDPVSLVQTILKDIEASKKQKTRFLLRMLPIEVTCKAYIDDIKEKIPVLLDKYFKEEEKTFSILINRRNSNMLSRDEVIAELADMIKMRNINNRVDLKQPQLTVVLEIIRSNCCIGILPDYFKFRKYNLLELASPEGKKNETKTSSDALPETEVSQQPCDSHIEVDTPIDDKSQKEEIAKGCDMSSQKVVDDSEVSSQNSQSQHATSECQESNPGDKPCDTTESKGKDTDHASQKVCEESTATV